jgi:hypothetical protein
LDKRWQSSAKTRSGLAHRTMSGGLSWSNVNWSLSGKERCDMAIIHRIVRWCTVLSGGAPYCPVSQRCQRPIVGRAINARHVARANGRLGTLDCLVRQPIPRTNGRLVPVWKEIEHRTATVVVRCTTRQKARIAYQIDVQRLLAALGL